MNSRNIMMLKRSALSVAIATVCTNAFAIGDVVGTDTDFRIVIGGATATEDTLKTQIINNVCDDVNPVDLYTDGTHFNIACTVDASVDAATPTVTFQKNGGGSSQGVLAVETADEVVLLNTGCATAGTTKTAGAGRSYTEHTGCAGTNETFAPDYGISDIEPASFTGPLGDFQLGSYDGGLLAAETASLPFGIVVTYQLYQALQAAQFPAGSSCSPAVVNAGIDDVGYKTIAGAVINNAVPGAFPGNGINDAYETFDTDTAQPVTIDLTETGTSYDTVLGTGAAGAVNWYVDETEAATGFGDRPHRHGDTAECMPTLSRTEIQSIMTGRLTTWADLKTQNGASNLVADATGKAWGTAGPASLKDKVTMCRRVKGSGTHGTISISLLRTTCGRASSTMPEFPSTGNMSIYQTTSSNGLGECLDDLATGHNNETTAVALGADGRGGNIPEIATLRAWAIGYQSLEKNYDLEEGYRFIKIDGVAGTLENFVAGDYRVFGTTTFNRRADNTYTTADAQGANALAASIYNKLAVNLGDASSLKVTNAAFVHPFGYSGFAGNPKTAGGVNILPVLPYDPINDDPIATISHTNPNDGTTDTCYGPIGRRDSAGTRLIVD
ncbi:MAG: hypothetical protein H6978_08215 [Gammaproteobacteria bacterium]|nr:hypothetical protein [Gammaproteobacteria bacterium]